MPGYTSGNLIMYNYNTVSTRKYNYSIIIFLLSHNYKKYILLSNLFLECNQQNYFSNSAAAGVILFIIIFISGGADCGGG